MTPAVDPLPVVIHERGLPRLAPRSPRLSSPWPSTSVIIDAARRHGTGGPAMLGRYLLRGTVSWERVEEWFTCRDGTPPGFVAPPGSGAVIPLRARTDDRNWGFLEDVIMHMAYHGPRAAIVGWDLPGIIGSLAAFTTDGGSDKGSLSHVLWTFVEGKHAGGEDRNRPRIEARPLEGGGARLSFTGRAKQDAQDYVPPVGREREQRRNRDVAELKQAGWERYEGRFADLHSLARTTTGIDRLSLAQACHAYGIDLRPDCAIALPENLVARLAAAEQLYDAILTELG